MMSSRVSLLRQYLTVLFLLVALPVVADEGVDPRASGALRRAGSILEGATTLSFTAEITVDEVTATNEKIQRGGVVHVLVRRPDRILVEHNGDRFHRKFAYNGKTLTILDVNSKLFGSLEFAGTIDEALDFAMQRFNIILPLADLVYTKPVGGLLERVRTGTYLGIHRVGVIPCHHLAFTQDNLDWQIWIDAGNRPVPRKIVITYKTLPMAPQYTAVLDAWMFDRTMRDEELDLVLPAGAERIEFLEKAEP